MKIDLDIKKMLEDAAEIVVNNVKKNPLTPKDTGDLINSVTVGEFNASNNSIDVFIDTDKLGVSKERQKVKPWHGKYYPELVHSGTKFMEANPFFTRAMEDLDLKDIGIDFIVKDTEWQD